MSFHLFNSYFASLSFKTFPNTFENKIFSLFQLSVCFCWYKDKLWDVYVCFKDILISLILNSIRQLLGSLRTPVYIYIITWWTWDDFIPFYITKYRKTYFIFTCVSSDFWKKYNTIKLTLSKGLIFQTLWKLFQKFAV